MYAIYRMSDGELLASFYYKTEAEDYISEKRDDYIWSNVDGQLAKLKERYPQDMLEDSDFLQGRIEVFYAMFEMQAEEEFELIEEDDWLLNINKINKNQELQNCYLVPCGCEKRIVLKLILDGWAAEVFTKDDLWERYSDNQEFYFNENSKMKPVVGQVGILCNVPVDTFFSKYV